MSAGGPRILHLTPAPAAEPGADGRDWHHPGGAVTGEDEPGYVQGSLAVDFRHEASDSFFGPQATPTEDLPDAAGWARRMLQATLEVCDGHRPAEQLARWVSPEVRERIGRRGHLARRRGVRRYRPPVVRTILTSHPADSVCEVSAVVWAGGRIRAVALRMSGVDGRWLITALEIG